MVADFINVCVYDAIGNFDNIWYYYAVECPILGPAPGFYCISSPTKLHPANPICAGDEGSCIPLNGSLLTPPGKCMPIPDELPQRKLHSTINNEHGTAFDRHVYKRKRKGDDQGHLPKSGVAVVAAAQNFPKPPAESKVRSEQIFAENVLVTDDHDTNGKPTRLFLLKVTSEDYPTPQFVGIGLPLDGGNYPKVPGAIEGNFSKYRMVQTSDCTFHVLLRG